MSETVEYIHINVPGVDLAPIPITTDLLQRCRRGTTAFRLHIARRLERHLKSQIPPKLRSRVFVQVMRALRASPISSE